MRKKEKGSRNSNYLSIGISFILLAIMSIVSAITAFAASSNLGYTSTYDMSGGIYSRNMDVGGAGHIKVRLYPNAEDKEAQKHPIIIYVDKKYFYGWASPGKGNNGVSVSGYYDSSTIMGNYDQGTYRVYLSNPHRYNSLKGVVKFSWNPQ